ncbi:MAG: rhodanese-like domain-containing protein [Candidatus Omnitrophica bacterium]|nr:rhodanese-like domain-containing protein [Candidatus Omnitrophota bacterium]
MKITGSQLQAMMAKGEKFKLVDVLGKESFEKEHIKGSISMPMDEIEKKAAKFLKKEEKVVVYCASFDCQASTHAAEKLIALGYKNVLDYKGGLKDSKEGGFPLEGSLHKQEAALGCSCCGC